MEWTIPQKNAIDIPVSDIIVSAAAGSGKTAVMAERIINRLTGKDYVDIDKILVVTYTNAAASEIKERVMKKIVEKLEESNSDVLQRQLVLIDCSHFCTIHSFCLDLLKKYFYKLGIDPNVKTGNPAELKLLSEQAVSDVFNEYFSNDDKAFKNLVNSFGKGKDSGLEKHIMAIYKFSRTMPDSHLWLSNLVDSYKDNNKSIQDCIVAYAKIALEYICSEIQYAIDLVNQYECCTEYLSNLGNEYNLFYNALSNGTSYDVMYNLVYGITFEKLPTSKTITDAKIKSKIQAIRDTVKRELTSLKEKLFCIPPYAVTADNENVLTVVEKIVEVTQKVGDRFDKLKREKNIIDFSDYEHMTLKLLKNADGSPSDIAKSVSTDFKEIYIDEYQDCNNIQNEIFKYVSGAIYGKPNMFCVGDMKQSIYKFRDANPMNFKAKCDNSEEYNGETVKFSNKIFLNSNFRSRRSVLDFVNNTFYQLMTSVCGELEYTKEEALSYGASFKDVNDNINSIEIDIINESNDFGDGVPKSEDYLYSNREAEVIHIANKIKNFVENDYLLFDSKNQIQHKARYRDIVVLFRSPSDYITSIEKVFGDMKIPHICDVKSDFYNTNEVGFLLSFLKIIDNPDDDISLVTVLKNKIFGFDENMLLKIKLNSGKKSFYKSILEYTEQKNDEISTKLSVFIQKLNNYHLKSKYMELGDFLLYVIEDLKYFVYLATFVDSEIKKTNVRTLVNKAKEFDSESFKGIFRFISYIDNIKQSEKDNSTKSIGEDDDVVRIMSIHKSKGLEFPIVILGGTGKNFNTQDSKTSILLHKNLGIGLDAVYYDKGYKVPTLSKLAIKQKIKYETMSEELRVLYVALTRPTEKLVITGSIKNGASHFNTLQNNLSFQKYQISPYLIMKSSCFLDIILLSSMRCEKFQDASFEKKNIICEDILFDVSLINKCAIYMDKNKNEISDWKSEFKSVTPDYEKMVSAFEFRYKHLESSFIPGNLSVTEIKKIKSSDSDEYNLFNEFTLEKPKNFLRDEKIAGNVFGTLVHLCMEKLDFSMIYNKDDILNQLNNLVNIGIISLEEKNSIDTEKLFKFTQSKIGKRISSHYNSVRREFSFKYLENASEILDTTISDKIIVQGTVDLFFEDDDGSLVVVDYKTDKVYNGDIKSVTQRYLVQLDCYSKALESILHKKVKEKIIYLFDVDKEVSL